MKLDENRVIVYALGGLLALAAIKFAGQMARSDAQTGRAILAGLIEGKNSVQQQIAWDQLQAFGFDVGEAYRKLPEKERTGYRLAFIQQFGKGFAQAGGTLKAFGQWRVTERTGDQIVVLADYPSRKQVLVLSLSAKGRKQLQRLEWQALDADRRG